MNSEMKIIIKAVTDSAQKGVREVKGELDKLSKSAKGSSGKMSAAFKGAAKGAAIAVAAFAAVGAALVALGKNTLQYQKEQAKLNAAFQAAGASAGQAAETYNNLYRFLGDSGKASEAANHLALITTNQKDLAEWTKIAQGVYATFGDSLPIEGLTEAANETLRVGKVTGTLADALNWAGVSEDEMNAKLAATNSLSEREAILRNSLNGIYSNAAEIYERNNKALLDYNESQARLDSTMGAAGQAVLPLMTALNNLGSAFFTALKPALDAIIPPIATFVNWIAKAIQSVLSFFGALTGKSSAIKAVGEIGGAAAGAASNLGAAAQGAKKLGSGMSGAEKAAEGAAKAAEEAKKSTQGFDELNIVSSGSSSSGGSGGGSGSGATPGYAGGGGGLAGVVDSAAFGVEVQESEGMASSLADKIKDTFSKLAEVFDPSIKAWSSAFETVKQSWEKSKPSYINGAKEILSSLKTLGSYIGTDFIPTITNSFSTNLAPMFGDISGFLVEELGKHFEWFGGWTNRITSEIAIPSLEQLKGMTTDVMDGIGAAWEEKGGGLLEQLSGFFESMRGHFDNFYNSVFKPVFDAIYEYIDFVWTNGLKPLWDKLVAGLMDIGANLLKLYNEIIAPVVDWIMTNIMPILVGVFETVMDVLGNLWVGVCNTLGGIWDALVGLIDFIVGIFTGDWEQAWEGIKAFFVGIWDSLVGICQTVWDSIVGILEIVWDVIVAIFETAWELIKGIWNVVVNFFKGVWDGICWVFENVGEWFSGIFSSAWEGIKNAWSAVTGWFTNIWSSIKNVFSSVGSWFKDIFSKAWDGIKNVFSSVGSFFTGIWDKIKSIFSKAGKTIGDAVSGAFKNAINWVLEKAVGLINGFIDSINWCVGIINKIPGVSISKITRLNVPKLATGGIVDGATIAMIGEQGKEAVVPLENNTGWMDALAERLAAKNNKPTKLILKVGERELGWATIDAINGITEQTGGLQLAL